MGNNTAAVPVTLVNMLIKSEANGTILDGQ